MYIVSSSAVVPKISILDRLLFCRVYSQHSTSFARRLRTKSAEEPIEPIDICELSTVGMISFDNCSYVVLEEKRLEKLLKTQVVFARENSQVLNAKKRIKCICVVIHFVWSHNSPSNWYKYAVMTSKFCPESSPANATRKPCELMVLILSIASRMRFRIPSS